jgi:hypothetical protein
VPVPTTAEDLATEDVRRVAHACLQRSVEHAARVTARVLEVLPELAPQHAPDEADVVRRSTEQNLGAMFAALAFGVAPEQVPAPPDTHVLLDHIVARGGDVTTVLRAYRVGQEVLLAGWTAEAAAQVPDRERLVEVLRRGSAHFCMFIDSACEHLVAEHRRRDGVLPGAGERPARAAVDALLSDEVVDAAAAEAATGHPLHLDQLALVLLPVAPGADAPTAVAALREAAGAADALAVPAGGGTWWAWLGLPAAADEPLLRRLADVPVGGLVVGAAAGGRGREGLRRGHAAALEAARTAGLAPVPRPGVVLHADVRFAAVLCADPERARRLAADRLGELAGDDEPTARLRETVRAYLRCGRSKLETARALHVHHKTVAYRLARAERLLGGPVDAAPGELEAALLIDRTLRGR